MLQAVLEHYSLLLRSARIDLVEQGGFSGARVWKLTTDAGAFALRQWPRPGLERARLTGLHRLLAHIFDRDLPQVAVPVTAKAGTTLVEVHSRLWQLEPWMPGTADFAEAPSDQKLSAALTALAHWHRAAARFVPTESERPWFASHDLAASPGISERLERIAVWNPGRLHNAEQKLAGLPWPEFRGVATEIVDCFRAKRRIIDNELRAASGIRFCLQPCLRDVWHDHVLYTGDEVTGLIDPAACRSETVAGDIARLVGSLIKDDRPRWDVALTAYQTVRPLSLTERGAVELFDRSGVLLSGMTWIDWVVFQGRPVTNPERVQKRLETILTRLQKLT